MQHIFNFWQILDIVLKLVLAVLCGGLVGLIKSSDKYAVNFSTLILTCFTSAFFIQVFMKLNMSMSSIEVSTAAVLIGFAIMGGSIIIGKVYINHITSLMLHSVLKKGGQSGR